MFIQCFSIIYGKFNLDVTCSLKLLFNIKMDDVQIEEALSASDFSISASESNSDDDDVITNDESYESDTSSSSELSNVSPAQLENNDDITSNWYPVTGNHQKHFTYQPNTMLPVQLQLNFEPLDYYKLFFTADILEGIVLETNKNAEQYLKSNRISRTSRYKK